VYQAAKTYAQSLEETTELFLTNPVDVSLDDGSGLSVRFIPPTRLDGVIGAYRSDVLILTRYPDPAETRDNRYGCSRKGNLVRNAFEEKQIDCNRWVVAGACPYTPPKHLATKKDSNIAQGQFLLKQIFEKVKPKYVLLLGAEAMKAFLRLYDKHKHKVAFKDCRGSTLVMPDGTIGVVCTSPEEVLKAPESLNDFNLDINYFISVLKAANSEEEKVAASQAHINIKPIVIDTLADLTVFVDWFTDSIKNAYMSVDLEWGAGHTLRTFQLAWSPDDCVVFHLNKAGLIPTELGSPENFKTFVQLLTKLFNANSYKVIGHNIRGDIKILRRFGLDLMPLFVSGGFDTMIAYHLVPGNETLEKQLELVAFRMLNCQRYDKPLRDWFAENKISEEQKELLGYGTVPDDILIPYGAMDAIVTYRVFLLLSKELSTNEHIYKLYYNVNHPLNEAILEMEETGLLCDQHRLRDLSDLFVNKSKELLNQLQEMVNWKTRTVQQTKIVRGKEKTVDVIEEGFNPDSPQHCQEVLFSKFNKKGRKAPPDANLLKLTPVKSTGGKAGSLPWEDVEAANMTQVTAAAVDAETLGILVNESPIVSTLHKYKVVNQLVKNLFTPYTHNPETGECVYEGGVGGNLSADGRFRTSFRTTLETGRYATSPQLQNWPKKQEAELIKIFTKDNVLDSRYKLAKSVLVADPGMVLLEADWNQAELWTLGYVSNDMKFIHTLQSTDLHTYMMRKMMGEFKYKDKYLSDFTVEELNVLRKKDKLLESWRTSAKAVVFGVAT